MAFEEERNKIHAQIILATLLLMLSKIQTLSMLSMNRFCFWQTPCMPVPIWWDPKKTSALKEQKAQDTGRYTMYTCKTSISFAAGRTRRSVQLCDDAWFVSHYCTHSFFSLSNFSRVRFRTAVFREERKTDATAISNEARLKLSMTEGLKRSCIHSRGYIQYLLGLRIIVMQQK